MHLIVRVGPNRARAPPPPYTRIPGIPEADNPVMAHSPRFRSELHIPIKQDNLNFKERQIERWGDMEKRMEERRKQWEDEFEKMRQEFFTLKPSDKHRGSIATVNNLTTAFEVDEDGKHKFKVHFDVSEFKPEEIQVKVQDNKIVVNARHEEKTATTSVSREYSRQVDIPGTVDQDKMQCVLSKDGILCLEAPAKPSALCKETMLPIQAESPKRTLEVGVPVKNPIITEPDGTRKIRLQVDVGEFTPEDIVVKTMDRKLVVHAESEEKTSGRTLHKEFNKEYDLPESVDQANITAYIGEDKLLTIEAPLKPQPPATQVRKTYAVTQSQDVKRVVVSKESSVTITDSQQRPMVTISVHRR